MFTKFLTFDSFFKLLIKKWNIPKSKFKFTFREANIRNHLSKEGFSACPFDMHSNPIDRVNVIGEITMAKNFTDCDEMFFKFWAHGAPVVAKLQLQPKWVIHAFGMGIIPYNHTKSANL